MKPRLMHWMTIEARRLIDKRLLGFDERHAAMETGLGRADMREA
jgi:hypothetical protein